MQKRIVSLITPLVVGIMALALGWFAHAALPRAAQGIVLDERATLLDRASPASSESQVTYQGRLTNKNTGAPINSTVVVTFTLYDFVGNTLWTSGPNRTVTPIGGLFTVYLGDSADTQALSSIVLENASSIGVHIGNDSGEMTPRQALNSIVGNSLNGVGVTGGSTFGIGVRGYSSAQTAVSGESGAGPGVYGGGQDGIGVEGQSFSSTAAGVLALGATPSGIALQIINGGIRVSGAGINSQTPMFTVRVVTGTVGNNVTPSSCSGNCVVLNNPLTDGRPSAIVIATANFSPGGAASGVYTEHPISVWYDTVISKWEIIHLDGTPMLNGAAYNVLVVNP